MFGSMQAGCREDVYIAPSHSAGCWFKMALQENADNHCCSHSLPPPQVLSETKDALKMQAVRLAKRADEHAQFINKIMYFCGVLSFGTFCFLLGSRPQDIPFLYCIFFIVMVPLRWMYYRSKKWHYYLLDFCYYANVIFMIMLLFYPNNERLFMVCFSFSEGPLAWALIIWRCSLVFNSLDKIVSVLIHLLPGTVFFIIRWWNPTTFSYHPTDHMGPWPVAKSSVAEWSWLFLVPLLAYCVWQALYFLIVEGLHRQRLHDDPEVMTSYRFVACSSRFLNHFWYSDGLKKMIRGLFSWLSCRELKRKAQRANNIWWRLSGLLGNERRVVMYAVIQAAFTIATLALTVPLFRSYSLHTLFEIFKLSATVWNGGNYLFDVMPRQMAARGNTECGNHTVIVASHVAITGSELNGVDSNFRALIGAGVKV